jgi:hypothetical protein
MKFIITISRVGVVLCHHLVYLGKTGNLHHHGMNVQSLKTSSHLEL